jgi:hypothetical protein
MAKEKNKIKECFVAFIDVLGFKDMIEEDNGSGKYLEIVKNAVEKGTRLLKQRQEDSNHSYRFWYEEFKVKSFSDCFCFSIPLEFNNGEKDYKQNLVAFYGWIKVFYNELLNQGFLCRGGISQGWHYSDDDIIFSKALIDAYLIESKRATHPIIMIDEKLRIEIKNKYFEQEEYYPFMFAHDNAGRNFLHPFNYSVVDEMFFSHKTSQSIDSDIKVRNELLEKYLVTLDNKIKSNAGKVQVDKYQWLKEFILYTLKNEHKDKFKSGLLF